MHRILYIISPVRNCGAYFYAKSGVKMLTENLRRGLWRLAAAEGFGELLLLLSGALGYGLLEIFWRGYTHWTMLVAGALCFCVIDYLDKSVSELGDWGKALLAALVITSVELIFGVVFNIYGGAYVWDYSALPFNFLGQICLFYAIIWVGLARILLPLRRWMARGLCKF